MTLQITRYYFNTCFSILIRKFQVSHLTLAYKVHNPSDRLSERPKYVYLSITYLK